MSNEDTECFAEVLDENEFFTEAEHMRELQTTINELEAAPTKANVMANTIKAMGQDITRLKATITELEAKLNDLPQAQD